MEECDHIITAYVKLYSACSV